MPIREGDSCTVAFDGIVMDVEGSTARVRPIAGDGRVTLPLSAITVTTPAIAVGDVCLQTVSGAIVTVLALAGDEAWVQDNTTGVRTTPKINKLERR